ncbi:SagB family peptide dehydrogenase [Bacillus sp. MCCB 382]|uniref:SagB family peptide dehydrogenase n=1 Tax=Bacillus sp. MCCB 382 TaxID=2860197 RepID=UPI001C571EAE|nr:SagB family peptide dehydrogenase [Bacillus sp. MCCB 382]
MSLESFLHNLQFDINRANLPGFEVDWEDAPLPYKLYRGLPAVPLSLEVPLSLSGRPGPVSLERIGHFLWYVYGISGVSESLYPDDTGSEEVSPIHSSRRFAPSGGALYPNELYIYLKLDDLPHGIYHYNPLHHQLVLLREGNVDSYVERALGNRCDISSCFATALISTRFWKNYFKYNNFSYRLQGLDAGVLMGQLLETSKQFGFESGVYAQFLDASINRLVGVSDEEESVYAVIPLSVEATNWAVGRSVMDRGVRSEELCRELPPADLKVYEKSERVKEFPMLLAVNEASKIRSTGEFHKRGKPCVDDKSRGIEILLPEVESSPYDFAEACRNRHSPEMDFVMGKVSVEKLSALLKTALQSYAYRSDLDEVPYDNGVGLSIVGCFYNVEGVPDGAYAYDSSRHALRKIQTGDFRLELQKGLSLDNVNLLQVPLCLHITGNRKSYQDTLGYRGYRIMQMEAGMLVQRLLLASSALGFGGHPLLGFDTKRTDHIYKLNSENQTTLIQLPIGPSRQRAWLKGSLMN